MFTWAKHQAEYLDEMLHLEGRGYAATHSTCGGCQRLNPTFRCENQTCHGPSLYCQTCIVDRHAALPTHWIQEWSGGFFQRCGLNTLGLVVQLGHPVGYGCPNAVRANKVFVVIDVTGVHTVTVNFCHCNGRVEHWQQLMRVRWLPATVCDPQMCATFAVVRLFQILNCLGKVSAHNFLRSLELLSNNDGFHPIPVRTFADGKKHGSDVSCIKDRHRAFQHILRMKRAGRGHDPTGIHGTAQGELALQCRTCPQPGKNLPEGWDKTDWEKMPEDLQYAPSHILLRFGMAIDRDQIQIFLVSSS
ncbi:hypothetical protein K438DRAFT_1585024 [Mycena galopus ATCC 62051]|nr:hypothetical protein K438DRAFT_1585024 [Mycena galopus ATCC 62051]